MPGGGKGGAGAELESEAKSTEKMVDENNLRCTSEAPPQKWRKLSVRAEHEWPMERPLVGEEVEVLMEEEGFCGSRYPATVLEVRETSDEREGAGGGGSGSGAASGSGSGAGGGRRALIEFHALFESADASSSIMEVVGTGPSSAAGTIADEEGGRLREWHSLAHLVPPPPSQEEEATEPKAGRRQVRGNRGG